MTLPTAMNNVWIGYTDLVRDALQNKGINWMNLENRSADALPNPVGAPSNNENSSRFVEDASYFRLKNLQIGYTIPKQYTEKAHIQRARVYVSGSNLLTATKYSGFDPEVGSGVDYGNYPQSRTWTFGVNLNF